jgi:dTDP-4-dehydrorhamnose reductase
MAIATAKFLQLDQSLIKKVNAADFTQPAKRPAITGLKIDKAKRELGYQPVSFKEGLRKTLE